METGGGGDGGGDYARLQSPFLAPSGAAASPPASARPPPVLPMTTTPGSSRPLSRRELLLQQSTLESTHSSELFELGDFDDDSVASTTPSHRLPPQEGRTRMPPSPSRPSSSAAGRQSLFDTDTFSLRSMFFSTRRGGGPAQQPPSSPPQQQPPPPLSTGPNQQNRAVMTSPPQPRGLGRRKLTAIPDGGALEEAATVDILDAANELTGDDPFDRSRFSSPLEPVLGQHGEPPGPQQQPTGSALYRPYKANSYFAIRLLRLTQLLVAVDIVALVLFYAARRRELYVAMPLETVFSLGESCAVTSSLAALVYHLLPAVIVLGLPASGWSMFEPFKREDRVGRNGRIQKVKRTIYLQVCEVTAIFDFFYLGMVAILTLYYAILGRLFNCPDHLSVLIFGAVAVVVYWLIYVQIRYFMRFREHLKMQLGAFSEADQTGDLRKHMLRSKMRRRWNRAQRQNAQVDNGEPGATKGPVTTPVIPPKAQIAEFVRKRLLRGAQLGDLKLLKRTLRIAKNHLGDNFPQEMYPDATFRLWFFCYSKKNPMHVAAYHGNIAAMELLFRANFSVNSFDKISRVRFSTGDIFWNMARHFIRQPVVSAEDTYLTTSLLKSTLVTPLHCAVSTGRVDAVRWLLQHGAEVNLCSKSSFRHESRLPPIFLADHPDIAKDLLIAGANHLVIPDPGHMNTITVLQLAYLRGNYAVAQVLENWGGDVALTPLHTAAAINDTGRIRHLLRKKVNPDCLGELGYVGLNKRTPLHWAAVNGAIDAVELLLGAKANPNFRDVRGRTPLHWAARVSRFEAVKILLEHGADPNIADEGGMTPLLCAACSGGTTAEMFKALVSSGANINHQLPATGDTALHIAVKLDDQMTAMALLSLGGDIMRMNHDGLRPIDCTTSTRLQFEIKRAAGNRDVMISYTHSHKEFALKLRKSLEDANITTWLDLMDPSGIGGGAVWREEIARGVTNAAVVMCILTDDYSQSQWCMKELALAKQVGTPILAISTEHAKISEDLQVYLYTRQIIPFEDAIASIDRENERDIRYTYNDDIYRRQLRLLLDGLRDEIEKRKEMNLRHNLLHAASSINSGLTVSSTITSLGNSVLGASGIGLGSRNRNQVASAPISAAYANPTAHFDERAAVTMLQERNLFEGASLDPTLPLKSSSTNPSRALLTQSAVNRWNGARSGFGGRAFEPNASILSSASGNGYYDDDIGLGIKNLTNSIILDSSGYYVHKPEPHLTRRREMSSPALSRRNGSHTNGSVLETVKQLREKTADGEQFVFICHGDSHGQFVKKLCAALCREGGVHCFVDRRRRLKALHSRIDSTDTIISPPSSGDSATSPQDDTDEDMLARIHDAKDAILKCTAFVIILSEKTLTNQLVKDQLAFAEDKGKKIIPIVVNRLEFSLDVQYTLSRSEFYHFFTSGDMIGFEKSLDRVLDTLRAEIYKIDELPELTPRLPKTMSFGQLSAISDQEILENVVRQRHGSGQSVASSNITSSSRGWYEPTGSQRYTRSFTSNASSHNSAPSRPLNSDMSFHQAMQTNFSSLMRRIPDDLEDEFDDDDIEPDLIRSVSMGVDDDDDDDLEEQLDSEHTRRLSHIPRLSSATSNSNSVSLLDLHSDDDIRSVDNVRPHSIQV